VSSVLGIASGHQVVLDAELSSSGISLGDRLGAVRDSVPAGVSVGIGSSIAQSRHRW